MSKQTLELENGYYEQLLRVIRFAGYVTPALVILVGLLIRQNYIDRSYYHSDLVFGLIAAGFLATSILLAMPFSGSRKVQAIASASFHVLGALFILFVSGFTSPFAVAWIMLLVAAEVYFGFKAYMLSVAVLFTTAIANEYIHPSASSQQFMAITTLCIFLVVIGYVLAQLISLDEKERQAYDRARRSESLQHERLTALINALGDAIISTDRQGRIRIYNAAALNLLDTNATLTGRKIDSLFSLVDEGGIAFSLFDYTSGVDRAFTRRDISHKYRDGEEINLYINASPIRPSYRSHKLQQGYIFILRDITKEKSLEEERDEFISVVSHELRTPIAIAEGNLSNVKLLMERKMDPALLPPAIESSYEQVSYLGKMINDLSTLSRAERGVADEPEEIDVAELIHTMYNEYQPQAAAKKLQLDLDLAPNIGKVMASRLYLEEVLQNFITNAIKYTQEGSVRIIVKPHGDDVLFAVRDSGIGISKSDQKKVFDKFYRSEDFRTRETSGTGLGLYVVRKLAAKLRVIIQVQSRLNHGSTFSFVLTRNMEQS